MKIIPAKFARKDIVERVNWINNPAINKSMYFELPATKEKTKKWFLDNSGNKTRIDFTFRNEIEEIIAMGGLTNINTEHSNAEFYIMVNPVLHGRGIGTKISKWINNYAFSVLSLNKVFLYTNDENEYAYKIYEKVGFQLEGVLREQKWKNGKFINRRFYGLLKREWKQMEWSKDIVDVL